MVHDLGVILLTAGIISIICKLLKQPVVLGYIVAGLLVGPYICGSAWIDNSESVETWGQIGVIFLLFALGLEFSFKKLLSVGSTAIVGCLTIVIGMMTSGFLLGRLFGWNEINSLFLGGMLCMSSTTIVFKALDDLGLRQEKFAGVTFGILIIEDLFAVVLMVLLSSIAVKKSFAGQEMVFQVLKLIAYLILWFVIGITIIPTFLRKFKKYLNDETMTIVSLGLCLGMVLLAVKCGFSSALGSFVMGSILAETIDAERITRLVNPIKYLFGAIFFVSVGMMINPSLLIEYWFSIAVITLTVIVGQIVFATIGITLAGQPLKIAMQSAFSLTQVGEFAFIIATFGESIGVTEKYLYPVIVAVSVITTFLTPYCIKFAVPAFEFVNRIMPRALHIFLYNYAKSRNTASEQSTMNALFKKVAIHLSIYSVICIFIITIYFAYFDDYIVQVINGPLPIGYEWPGNLISLFIILLLLSPFIFKILTKHLHSTESGVLWADGGIHRGYVVILFLARMIIAMMFLGFCVMHKFNLTGGMLLVLVILVTIAILGSKKIQKSSKLIEQNFMQNLTARELAQEKATEVGKELEDELMNYDLHLANFSLSHDSKYCGKQLKDLNLKSASGVTIVRIVRGKTILNVPGGQESLQPNDEIVVAGSDKQISAFQDWLKRGM